MDCNRQWCLLFRCHGEDSISGLSSLARKERSPNCIYDFLKCIQLCKHLKYFYQWAKQMWYRWSVRSWHLGLSLPIIHWMYWAYLSQAQSRIGNNICWDPETLALLVPGLGQMKNFQNLLMTLVMSCQMICTTLFWAHRSTEWRNTHRNIRKFHS